MERTAPHTRSRALLYCAGGGIGDSLVATVVARALREKYEGVDALTLAPHLQTLLRVPDVDDVLVDEGDEKDVVATLTDRGYAATVVTWATARTARIAQRARIALRVGQARRLYSHRFTHRIVVRSENGDITSHWSDILLDYARALGCDAANRTPAFVPTQDDVRDAEAFVRERLNGSRFFIIHATNAIAVRRAWPTAGWIRLARTLVERYALPVVVTGSDADRAIATEIANASGAVVAAGALSIGAFGALAARARCFVGISTGSMHVAAAAGAPTVGIFPFQTDTPERWGPRGRRTTTVRATFPCRPGERKETCPDYACVANLNIGRIMSAVDETVEAEAVP